MMRQQHAGFSAAEGKVTGPDLGQLPGKAVPVQRQQRIDPRRDYQVQGCHGIPEYVVKVFQDGRFGQQVEVVQHHHHGLILGGQRRREPDEEGVIDGHPARPGQHRRHGDARPSQGGYDIGPEHPGLVVVTVQGEPR